MNPKDQIISIVSAESISQADYIQTVNQAYADYFVPIQFTRQSFEEMLERESVRFSSSALAIADGKPVGVGLLGVRGKRAWIGGLGVIPERRLQGIGRQLMCYLIEQADLFGIRKIVLEVITENNIARHLYQSMGFQLTRKLLILYCNAPSFKALLPVEHLHIQKMEPESLLDAVKSMPRSSPLPWQREPEPIQMMSNITYGIGAMLNGKLVGACLYAGDSFAVGLLDLIAESSAIASYLLQAVYSEYPEAHFSYINVDENDPALEALFAGGFYEGLSQYEMVYEFEGALPAEC